MVCIHLSPILYPDTHSSVDHTERFYLFVIKSTLAYRKQYVDGTRYAVAKSLVTWKQCTIFKRHVYNILCIIQDYIISSPFRVALAHRVGCWKLLLSHIFLNWYCDKQCAINRSSWFSLRCSSDLSMFGYHKTTCDAIRLCKRSDIRQQCNLASLGVKKPCSWSPAGSRYIWWQW